MTAKTDTADSDKLLLDIWHSLCAYDDDDETVHMPVEVRDRLAAYLMERGLAYPDVETREFILPFGWVHVLLGGSERCLRNEELTRCERWCVVHGAYYSIRALEYAGFFEYHDARAFGSPACHCVRVVCKYVKR